MQSTQAPAPAPPVRAIIPPAPAVIPPTPPAPAVTRAKKSVPAMVPNQSKQIYRTCLVCDCELNVKSMTAHMRRHEAKRDGGCVCSTC